LIFFAPFIGKLPLTDISAVLILIFLGRILIVQLILLH